MKQSKLYLLFAVLLVSISCEKLFMKPNADTSNQAIFEEYTKLVKEKYAMLEFKEVDIDFLSDSIGATITENLTDSALLWKLTYITSRLRDGHSSLIAFFPYGVYGYSFDPKQGFDLAFDEDVLDSLYFSNMTKPLNQFGYIESRGKYQFVYGRFEQNPNIGYLRIPTFSDARLADELETIFASFKTATGLVVDLRDNGGGDPSLATKVASYFMETTTYSGYERFKTGPNPDDFSNSYSYVNPSSSANRYLNNVVVLTDRGVYSAATTFCYNLAPLEQVIFLGQRTGGGSGSVADGFLANGWAYSLSISEFIDIHGNHLDDGVDPDISVSLDLNDNSKDELIEEAISILQ